MKQEFGSKSGDYWRGLDDLHELTKDGKFKLQVNITSRANGAVYTIDYSTFQVGDESSNYQLQIAGFDGNFAYDAFQGYTGYKFTAKDRDNDATTTANCATALQGAWWYNTCSCGACLTQGSASNFQWKLGFTSTPLSNVTMALVCK